MWHWWPWRVEHKLDKLLERTHQMSVDQQHFDEHLTAFLGVVTSLIAAIEAWIATHPPGTDLSAEDQAVIDAATAAQAELEKITAPPE